MAYQFNTFPDGAALAEALAETVAGRLAEAIAARGRGTLAVSGGSTPKAFFKALSAKAIDWPKVTITLVDERFVPETNDRSNHKLVADNLLQNQAAKARFLPLYHAVADAEDAALVATGDARRLDLPFDVVILGMGGDGHTASFFPGGNNLERALDPRAPRGVMTMEAQDAGEPRLTFTFNALRDARLLVLHIEGAAKKPVIDRALADGKESTLPIGRVIANAVSDIEIYWAP